MLTLNHFSYGFPQKDLYNAIDFTLEEGQHCAFIGMSGSGKSTLIDIILDPEKYMFEGDLEIASDCKIGYVSQFIDAEIDKSQTVFSYIASDCLALQAHLDDLCAQMATESDLEPILEAYQEALDAFEAIGGDRFESEITKQLNLANLSDLADRSLLQLSGGEFKLVQVIREMLTQPHLLIMDEPDVFLDFEHLNALKKLINSHKGTLLVITHSRYLLNHCFNKIIHLENKELQEFDGNYMAYNFSLLEKKIELQELATADTEEIERNAALIEKLRDIASNNAEPARGKSLKARVKIQERLEARRIKAPFVEIKQPHLTLHTAQPFEDTETVVLKVEDFNLSFDQELLRDVHFEIKATDKVALIGANGTGKTSLLRELFKASAESITVHPEAHVAYLSQVQGEMLDEEATLLDTFLSLGFEKNQDVITYLSAYHFDEETVHQKIKTLSGGEKNILQLAKIGVGNANVLLLDEPTSHLDTYAQLALEEAISAYNGAIVMVSHDFYSIVNCMDYALLIDEHSVRKVSMRKFRKMIYQSHFNKDYLELEQKKKALEVRIAMALQANDFVNAKVLCTDLENCINLM